MKQLAERLTALVPKNSPRLLSDLSHECNHRRYSIITRCRFITLYPYLWNPPQPCLSFFPSKDSRSFLFRPPDPTFFGVSQLSQNCSLVISHLIDHPLILARIVIERSAYVDFEHIIRSVLPSFFGFFASDEHLSHAIAFYSEVVRLATPQLIVSILDPLFNSAPTVRFLEVALDDFFTPFLLECSIASTRDLEPLAASHGSFLVDCFTRAAPLLPSGHRSLLCLLRDRRFPGLEFRELVLKRFLWAAAFARLRASAAAREVRYLQMVLLSIVRQKQILKKLFQGILECHTSFHLPCLFGSFDESFLIYYLCVNDACLLARLLDQAGELPAGLRLADFLDIDGAFKYWSFWCQVFPRRTLPAQTMVLRLVFPAKLNGLKTRFPDLLQLADQFETLMEERRKAAEAIEWRRLLAAHAELLMGGEIGWLRKHQELRVPRRVRQKIEIGMIGGVIVNDPEVRRLSERWDAFVGQRNSLPSGVSHRVWGALRIARAAGCAQLEDAFPLLLNAVKQLRTIAETAGGGEPMISAMLRMIPGNAIVAPFVIINAAVAHIPGFMSDLDQRCWVTLERCFLAVLCEDGKLLKDVITKQAAIEQFTRQRTGSNA
jgi:hypothetical protein